MMRNFWKTGIIFLMLIICALVALPASAEEMSVLSEQQASLWQGQTSQVYEVTLNCPGTATVTSSYGARFDLYAKKKWGYGSCPSASSIQYNYDKVAYGYSGTTSMTLEAGTWCLVVYGYSGGGTYSLRVTSYCPYPTPTPYPTTYPTPPTPCGVYKSDTRQGYLNQGQAAVYGYFIPSDGRSKIEWSMSSSGSGGSTPVIVASDGMSVESSSYGNAFDLYVFKDCNPKNSYCNTRHYSKGPNAYVSVAPPSSGSTYYAMVYARSGSGNYNLKMNSYKCGGSTPIIVASAGMDVTASDDTGSGAEVSAPSADFVILE